MGVNAPLVLLHGLLGGPWSFDGVLTHLSTRHDVLCPALSFHTSGCVSNAREITFSAEVDRIASLIQRRFDAEPATLLGYSMGGRIALGLAIRYPSMVRRLVLISSRRGLDTATERSARLASDERWANLAETSGSARFLEAWWDQPIFSSLTRLPADVLAREAQSRKAHDPQKLAMALRQFSLGAQPDYAREVRNLTVPTVLVAGELDPKFVLLARELENLLPNGRVIVVEDVGHHLLLEAPATVAKVIDEEMER